MRYNFKTFILRIHKRKIIINLKKTKTMKKKLIKEKKQIISAVIPDEICKELEKYAQKKERSKSWIIKKAINNFLKENENR